MKIMVVDDDFVSREKLMVILSTDGYDVVSASNGKEAYEIWVTQNPRIIITDWNMPVMDGLELISKIRADPREDYSYIIIVTGRNNIQDMIKGIEKGADDYLTKPFNKEELQVRIKAGKRVLNNLSKDIVIFALAKLAESRDEDTGNHLERVRFYSKSISEKLIASSNRPEELDRVLIENIFLTSPLHDIGKVAIPDYILLKPGRLNNQEFTIMKSHAQIGYETLKEAIKRAPNANYLNVAAQIARYHHEQYDGNGYPKGLQGDQIPLAARIFAIADVYDALVSKRPYKEPFAHERAVSIIKEGKGTHFDPMVVDAFLDCQEDIKNIRANYLDT